VEDGNGIKRKFIAEVRTAMGRLYFYVAIDRVLKIAFTEPERFTFDPLQQMPGPNIEPPHRGRSGRSVFRTDGCAPGGGGEI
jgi:hypothetical protein